MQPSSSGLDGDRKINSFMVCGTRFDVDERYTLVKPIGHGAYGVVCSAHDNVSGEKVAIKKINRAFDHLTDTKRTLREIRILRHFTHENVIRIRDILRPVAPDKFEDVYIVSELMDTDLHQIISSPQPLTDDHCQYFLYQILRALKYIHSAHVLHRDLKPSNLLLNGNCDLKVCDFGLARVAHPEENHAGFMTEYVATRWYRAPEIMLSWKEYTKAIDVWSVGCIFAELLGRKPLFPGKDYIHQLNLITDVIGTPDDEDIECIESEKARRYIRSLPYKPRIPLEKVYPNANPLALSLLQRMLCFHPEKRITIEEALQDPYLASLHDPSDEPLAHAEFSFEFEKMQLSKQHLRQLITKEMLAFHPDCGWDPESMLSAPDVPPQPPPQPPDGGGSQPVAPTAAGGGNGVAPVQAADDAMAVEPNRVADAATAPEALAGEATLEDELGGEAQSMQED